MSLRLPIINPEKNKAFDKCELGREKYAKVLTEIVRTYADGFVMAINNDWGTGKTTFVKMWRQYLDDLDFKTFYFNAWENDFDSNPLIAIMAELERLTNNDEHKQKVFKSVLKKGSVLIRNVAPALAKSLIKRYVVDLDDVAVELIENTTKASTEILENQIKEYSSKKKTIIEFREELEKFLKTHGTDMPIVFIIDELDRCRPNYSVEVLEQVKHFFSVSGIVFVLSIDKKHLASSIKGFYGSESINTDEYLRRFIDLEYSIPEPPIGVYANYLFKAFEIDNILSRVKSANAKDSILKTAELLFMKSNATLRQQEKMFAQLRIVLQTFAPNYTIIPYVLMLLIFVKTMHNSLYRDIQNGRLTLQQLCGKLDELVPGNIEDYNDINYIHLEAEILFLYYNRGENLHDKHRITDVKDWKLNPEIKSKLSVNSEVNLLKNYFDNFSSDLLYKRRLDLDYLLTKINLIEPIQL